MKTVFVTGAGGFTGSRVVAHLRERGFDVVAGVRNRARKLAYERQSARALVCDLADPINVARAVAGVRPDGIIHLGGVATAAQAAADPLTAYQSIVTSWANVLDAVRRCVPRCRVVLASAFDVYGAACADRAVKEDAALAPTSTFGSLKAAAEAIAHTFFRDYHLDLTIARPFAYTGAGQPPQFYFAAAAQQIAQMEPPAETVLHIPDLNCRRDVLHITDVVCAYERLLVDGQPNETYNICSGQTYTCRELIQTMIAHTGRNLQLAETATSEAQHQCVCGDNAKLRALSWSPAHPIQLAVEELIQSYQTSAATLMPAS